jgi:hypothetical protein
LATPAPGAEGAVSAWRQKIKLFIHLYVKSINRTIQADFSIRDFGFQYCSHAPPDV